MRGGLALAAVVALLAAPTAMAGTNGTWTPVTTDFNQTFNLVGLQRTADGVLHVAAQQKNAANPNHQDLVHIPIGPDGVAGPVATIAPDWASLNSPDLIANPGGGLLTIWGGIHSTTTGDPLNNGSFATSDDSGAAWTMDPVGPWPSGGTAGGSFVYAAQIAAANGADGTPFEAWTHGGVYVHRGLNPTTPVSDYNAALGGESTAIPAFGLDAGNGKLWIAWENGLGQNGIGVWAQEVDQASGAPVGSAIQMPGSVTPYQGSPESSTLLGRTPITGRPGRPGVWMSYPVGYPSLNKLLLWKVGDSAATTLATAKDGEIRQAALTAAPDGRLIAVWDQSGGGDKLFVRVSNTDATAWGAPFEIKPPKEESETWALQASAQSGGLVDILQNYTEGSGSPVRFWHTQALEPPELAKSVDASVVSGVVLIKLPGSNNFVPLAHDSNIPVGATVDATKGRVRILTAVPGGKTQSADFFQGVFAVTQAKTGLATMALAAGNFGVCGKSARVAGAAKVKVVRKLWAAGKGKFQTKGKYATAAIRGTTWLTQDQCNGTLVRVTQGKVLVRALKGHASRVLTKGQSFLVPKD